MSDSVQTVLLESMVMTGFSIAAVVGFKSSAWIVVGGLAGHGAFDALHRNILENSGVPVWWPAFCLAYDSERQVAWPGSSNAGQVLKCLREPRVPGRRSALPCVADRPWGHFCRSRRDSSPSSSIRAGCVSLGKARRRDRVPVAGCDRLYAGGHQNKVL